MKRIQDLEHDSIVKAAERVWTEEHDGPATEAQKARVHLQKAAKGLEEALYHVRRAGWFHLAKEGGDEETGGGILSEVPRALESALETIEAQIKNLGERA